MLKKTNRRSMLFCAFWQTLLKKSPKILDLSYAGDDMTLVELKRIAHEATGVHGALIVNGKPVCVTTERPWLDNKPRESCIPAGLYSCVKFSGEKYKDVWELQNVPNRSAILIHQGNVAMKDSLGCILVGKGFANFGGLTGVTDSVVTLNFLRATLPDKFNIRIIDGL